MKTNILFFIKDSVRISTIQNIYLPELFALQSKEFILQNFDAKIKYLPIPDEKINYDSLTNQEIIEQTELFTDELNTYDYILVGDSKWFKAITKQVQSEKTIGNLFPCRIDGITNPKISYLPPEAYHLKFPVLFKQLTKKVFKTILEDYNKISNTDDSIITIYEPNSTKEELQSVFNTLLKKDILTCDIETKHLKATNAEMYTIAFGIDIKNAVTIPVDAHNNPDMIRALLKDFFEKYQGKLIFHKANFDCSVIIYELFMNKDFTNLEGQLYGLNTLLDKVEDTLLIAYLSTNNCGENKIGLKELALPYLGNWGIDTENLTEYPIQDVMYYNGKDCIATWYVYNTYYPKMIEENQLDLYENHFKPYLKDSIRMQLNGLPIDLNEVSKLKKELENIIEKIDNFFKNNNMILDTQMILSEIATKQRNAKLKTKVTTIEDNYVDFNPKSNKHLSVLLYDVLELPIIEYTKKKNPSTSGDTLDKLLDYCKVNNKQEEKEIIENLLEYAQVFTILKTFIPAFENASVDDKGNVRLTGFFNLGGTKSGRMSSDKPNLQNLPSTGTPLAKVIKKCFKSNKDWLMVGIDFNALEERIGSLLTKDPNRLKVYTEGYDSHCLRAYSYFKDKMPDIHLLDETKKYERIIYDDGSEEIVEV